MTTKAKHTPGPWRNPKNLGHSEGVWHFTVETPRYDMRLKFDIGIGIAEAEANSALIAAAPELLEALKSLYGEGKTTDIINQVRQVISKAEGETR